MTKKTAKLKAAEEILGIEHNPAQPVIVVYGKMAERGYSWDGVSWSSDGKMTIAYPALVRVSGTLADVNALADCIAMALWREGLVVVRKRPQPDRDGNGYRVYLDVE